MHFGESREILALAKKRFAEVKSAYPDAALIDPEDVQTLYLTFFIPGTITSSPVCRRDIKGEFRGTWR